MCQCHIGFPKRKNYPSIPDFYAEAWKRKRSEIFYDFFEKSFGWRNYTVGKKHQKEYKFGIAQNIAKGKNS